MDILSRAPENVKRHLFFIIKTVTTQFLQPFKTNMMMIRFDDDTKCGINQMSRGDKLEALWLRWIKYGFPYQRAHRATQVLWGELPDRWGRKFSTK